MDKQFTEQEIRWYTETKYVDIETGEEISKEKAIKAYVIINKKKTNEVYKKTGTTTWIYECKTSTQLKLF